MARRFVIVAASCVIAALASAGMKWPGLSAPLPWPRVLTVHEWGTFTTVAGPDGHAAPWIPLGGPSDLPCFVEHFQNNPLVKVVPGEVRTVDYATARARFTAKVRMETPVLYFYAPNETSATVTVRFRRGLITEWYPHATVTQPPVPVASLLVPSTVSTIEWRDLRLSASNRPTFPTEEGASHYYAARQTEATPLRVGTQSEKFLFYRGVGDFDVPLSAVVLANGALRMRNLGSTTIPALVFFERRGASIAFRVHGPVAREVTIDRPAVGASLDALRSELARLLVHAGLYAKEAAAMVETWRDSWFEEGTRIFYLLPEEAVSAVLPLSITPQPERVARVFVGRMEVITRDDETIVESAVARGDFGTLSRYGRFLGPIADRLLARSSDAANTARLNQLTNAVFAAYLKRTPLCE